MEKNLKKYGHAKYPIKELMCTEVGKAVGITGYGGGLV